MILVNLDVCGLTRNLTQWIFQKITDGLVAVVSSCTALDGGQWDPDTLTKTTNEFQLSL